MGLRWQPGINQDTGISKWQSGTYPANVQSEQDQKIAMLSQHRLKAPSSKEKLQSETKKRHWKGSSSVKENVARTFSSVMGSSKQKLGSIVVPSAPSASEEKDQDGISEKPSPSEDANTEPSSAVRNHGEESSAMKNSISKFALKKFVDLRQGLSGLRRPFTAKVYVKGNVVVGEGAFSKVFDATYGKQSVVVATGEGIEKSTVFSDREKAVKEAEKTKDVYKGLRKKLGRIVPRIYLATAEKSSVKEGAYTTGIVQERLMPLDTKKMTQKERNQFCRDIMKGLKRAHDHQVFHGDIKDQNILMRPKGHGFEPVMIDWDDTILDIQDMKNQIDAMTTPDQILDFLKELSEQYSEKNGVFGSERALGSEGWYDGNLSGLARLKLGDTSKFMNEGMSILDTINSDIKDLGDQWKQAGISDQTQAVATSVKNQLDELFNTLKQLDLAAAGRVVYETYLQESFEYEVDFGPNQPNTFRPFTNDMVHEKIQARNADPNHPNIPKDIQEFLERAFPVVP